MTTIKPVPAVADFFSILEKGDRQEACRLLNEGIVSPHARNAAGMPAIIMAATKGEPLVIECLLNLGADIEAVDAKGHTALVAAVNCAYSSVVHKLVSHNANVNVRDQGGNTVLMIACRKEDATIVASLLDLGADVDAKDKDGRTALMFAAQTNNEQIVGILLEDRASVNLVDDRGNTALLMSLMSAAARYSHPATVKRLLDAGADPTVVNNDGKTPLSAAKSHPETRPMLQAAIAKTMAARAAVEAEAKERATQAAIEDNQARLKAGPARRSLVFKK